LREPIKAARLASSSGVDRLVRMTYLVSFVDDD
jgi:hypothetical protein